MRLIDADALKKKIFTTTFTKNNMWAINLLIGLIDDIPNDDAWISVNDRLPKEKEHVLIWINDLCLIIIDWIVNGKWVVADEFITHWMPLPEPPKEGDNE